ncbi:MAG: hypothetical protein H6529_10770 [Nocardioides sp.]|nr:hypothetical protein [Nocardioides sp.]
MSTNGTTTSAQSTMNSESRMPGRRPAGRNRLSTPRTGHVPRVGDGDPEDDEELRDGLVAPLRRRPRRAADQREDQLGKSSSMNTAGVIVRISPLRDARSTGGATRGDSAEERMRYGEVEARVEEAIDRPEQQRLAPAREEAEPTSRRRRWRWRRH